MIVFFIFPSYNGVNKKSNASQPNERDTLQKNNDKGDSIMETIASIMETLMVICFGISWPLNIIKAWKSRTAQGTSILFYSFIFIGYIFALVGKFVLIHLNAPNPWYETVHWYVMFFYILNILMVSTGIFIYIRNKILDRTILKITTQ